MEKKAKRKILDEVNLIHKEKQNDADQKDNQQKRSTATGMQA